MKIKTILSPETIKSIDGVLEHRQTTTDRLKDEIQRNADCLAPDGSFDVTDEEQQRGRVLPRALLVRKIHKLNRNLWYERSIAFPDRGGLYVAEPSSPYGKRQVCAFPHDRVNEFATRMYLPDVIPHHSLEPVWEDLKRANQQIPGWRAVLDKLIKEGFITSAQAEKEFKISQGRSSKYWQKSQETVH